MASIVFAGQNNHNFTIISFQFNSNMRIVTPQQFDDFEQEMSDLIQKELPKYSDWLFGNASVIKKVTFETFGVEVGSIQKRGHVHTTVRIEHKVPNYSVGKLNRRLKLWLDTYGPGNGWYVYSRLTKDGAQLNYDNKRLRDIENARVINSGFEAEEMNRLSDEVGGLAL
jgi:hypothetical protein